MIRPPSTVAFRAAAVLAAAAATFGLAAVLAVTAAAAEPLPLHSARDKSERPPGPPPPDVLRVPLDCNAAVDTVAVSPALVDTLTGDTTGGSSQAPQYACSPWNETGPERIYRLEVTENTELRAALSDLGDNDLDLFLLSACDSDACVGYANVELVAWLAPGTFYLVVDGFNGAAGTYTLALEGRYQGVPGEICEPNDFVVPVLPEQNGVVVDVRSLFGQPNRIQSYDCSEVVVRGGEVWYAISLPDSGSVAVDFTSVADSLDVALWLFDGCGPSAACLGFADDRLAGQPEQLDWRNLTGGRVTVYLAVDSFRAPTNEANGSYTMGLDLVPVTRSTLSGVKDLFRRRRP